MVFIGSKWPLQKINKNYSRFCKNILFFNFYGQISDFFITLTQKIANLFFPKIAISKWLHETKKNDCNFLDITLYDILAEYEVDPTLFLGLDWFLVNVLPSFWEILCIISGKYTENKDFMFLKSYSIGREGK